MKSNTTSRRDQELKMRTESGLAYSEANKKTFWEDVETFLNGVRLLLTETHVETQAEALKGIYRPEVSEDAERGAMTVIKRRQVSEDFDQLDYYISRGRCLLERVIELIDERRMTYEFVLVWADLQTCYGFLLAHYFDNSDDLRPERGGEASKVFAQKVWVALSIAPFLHKRGDKERLMKELSEYILVQIAGKGEYACWFKKIIDEDTRSYRHSFAHLTVKALRTLAQEDIGGRLPPVPDWPRKKPPVW